LEVMSQATEETPSGGYGGRGDHVSISAVQRQIAKRKARQSRANRLKLRMARGWESKAVEEQIQAQGPQLRINSDSRDPLTPAQSDARRRREVLVLSRVRVQTDIKASQQGRYQDQLHRALADLDAQISALKDVG
jgi:hypothetical protein